MSNIEKIRQKNNSEVFEEQKDPYGISYPESAAKYIWYRITVALFAAFLIFIGKSNLPQDSVTCIEDTVLESLSSITNFYKENISIGLIFMTIMQLLVDIQLIGMAIFWYYKGQSFRYPLLLIILGFSKILLNILFEVRQIQGAFNENVIPSLCFGQNFKNTYFFSGIIAFLLINLLEFRKFSYSILMKIQIFIIIYCIFMLLSMKQNFFMDIVTGLVFSHITFIIVDENAQNIDKKINQMLRKDNQSQIFQK